MNRSPMRCIRTERYKLILNLAPDTPYKTHISHGVAADGLDYWQSWERLAKVDPKAAAVVQRYHQRPALQVYDLRKDPHELRNIALDPSQARTVTELFDKLQAWRMSQGEDLKRVPLPEDARTGEVPYAR